MARGASPSGTRLRRPGKASAAPDEATARVRALSDIVRDLVVQASSGGDVDLNAIKREACSRHGAARPPRLVDVVNALPPEARASLLPRLRAKPVRSASGVAVVAVMSKPHRCPHVATTGAVCVYCPGGPDSDFEYSTQSYTGHEPTSMRAIRARYDPYEQARARVDQLRRLGHPVDKVEFILMGGTFMSLPADYRERFAAALHDALSGASSGGDVDAAVAAAEHGKSRCVGMTIETRPDYCLRPHLAAMLRYGCTRLEIGLQSPYEDVARDTNRGHTVAAAAACFALSRDHGFKVVAHLMPALPNVDAQRDLEAFREVFENPRFRPDGLKIYPTLVIRGTGLYELWRRGLYRSPDPRALVDLIARALDVIPPWARVYRIQRDIPLPLVSSGVDRGNLRELAHARSAELGLRVRDVRTREAGIVDIHRKVRPENVELVRRDYVAGEGWETFLAFEDPEQDILVGLLRLRRLAGSEAERHKDLSGRCSMIREVHVYGSAVAVHERDAARFQHHGYGAALVAEAERIAMREHGSSKMAIISGVGTRHYYRKLGYELVGPYMMKELQFNCAGRAAGGARRRRRLERRG